MGSGENLNQDKMYIVDKLFGVNTIRAVWDNEAEKYYLSVVDVVGILTESSEPRKYWNWLKKKVEEEDGFQLSSIARQLKLKAADGKYRLTDVVGIEGMFQVFRLANL